MRSLNEIQSQHHRLAILLLLSVANGYDLNSEMLRIALKNEGYRLGRDLIATELHWLAEQGLVEIEQVNQFLVAKLTDRGEDVAQGHVSVPGVKRPAPSDV